MSKAALLSWMRRNLFADVRSSLITVLLGSLSLWLASRFISWALLNAVFSGNDPAQCRAVEGTGACWIFIREKFRLILFGMYPYEEQYRPGVALAVVIPLLFASGVRRFWTRWLVVAWVVTLAATAVLMWGGVFGLPYVDEDRWGGLPVTLIIVLFGTTFSFPLAIALALCRRSTRFPAFRAIATGYVEVVRALPLVMVLFMVSVMLPLLLPEGAGVSKLARVVVAFTLFTAAYLSEPIRGGLQAIPRGQLDAAGALGLSTWGTARHVLLPQALRIAIPGMVNTFIGFFKATSIVTVVGIYDILTAAKRAMADRVWQGFGTEAYLFIAVIYFIFCFAMSRYSQGLEKRLAVGR
jgi:general L-amino acid transport system permease protein